MISVVMASYLGYYPGCASNRPYKLRRAIESFLSQGIGELIVSPDGCQETVSICSEYPVKCLPAGEKMPAFSGAVRNRAIDAAQYDYIAYLYSDDILVDGHLAAIAENMDSDWLWWDDYLDVIRRSVRLELGCIGTSAIAHKKSLGIVWPDGYAHDWKVVEQLIGHKGRKIEANYKVMHIPGVMDS